MTSYDISIPLQILAVSNMILHISMWQEINLMFLKMSFVKCYRCVTYRSGGNDLLCDDPQRVHHRDVAQPPSNTQSSVTILDKNAQWNQTYIGNYIYLCIYAYMCVWGRGFCTHHSDSIGLGTILQQNIDDVCVSLLGCLVKGSVSILGGKEHGTLK